LQEEEIEVIINRLTKIFSHDSQEQEQLRRELKGYVFADVDFEQLLNQIESQEEKELIAQISYEVIGSTAIPAGGGMINQPEKLAYQRLLEKLNLPTEIVQKIEAKATQGEL
jgi:uncharacterized protein YkuJ